MVTITIQKDRKNRKTQPAEPRSSLETVIVGRAWERAQRDAPFLCSDEEKEETEGGGRRVKGMRKRGEGAWTKRLKEIIKKEDNYEEKRRKVSHWKGRLEWKRGNGRRVKGMENWEEIMYRIWRSLGEKGKRIKRLNKTKRDLGEKVKKKKLGLGEKIEQSARVSMTRKEKKDWGKMLKIRGTEGREQRGWKERGSVRKWKSGWRKLYQEEKEKEEQ